MIGLNNEAASAPHGKLKASRTILLGRNLSERLPGDEFRQDHHKPQWWQVDVPYRKKS
jgi:hypothetical protein